MRCRIKESIDPPRPWNRPCEFRANWLRARVELAMAERAVERAGPLVRQSKRT